jgi:hypothetical protein
MPDNSSDNIFASLKGLIWGAFIGVVSFQLLAPIVWGYLHAALGLDYYKSYWIFTLVYFLSLPTIVLGWLYSKRPLISKYLPNYKGDTTATANVFLYGLMVFVAAQFCITISGFFGHWSDRIFYIVCGFYTFCCGALLFGCYMFCNQHIRKTFSNPNQPRNEAGAKAKQYFNKLFWPTSAVFVLLFWMAFGFIYHWLSQNEIKQAGSNKYSSYSAGLRSFAFQEMNETLNGKFGQLQAIEDSVARDSIETALDSSSYKREYTVGGNATNDLNTSKDLDTILTKYSTDLRILEREVEQTSTYTENKSG